MRYNTEVYSKSNSIGLNPIKKNQFEIKQNRIEQNGDQISRRDKIKVHEIWYDMIL